MEAAGLSSREAEAKAAEERKKKAERDWEFVGSVRDNKPQGLRDAREDGSGNPRERYGVKREDEEDSSPPRRSTGQDEGGRIHENDARIRRKREHDSSDSDDDGHQKRQVHQRARGCSAQRL